jgi:hypothetical protein
VRRVLIVSPRFPPVNAADHHRVRTSLPYFSAFGWEPTVLAVTPGNSDGVPDSMLLESVPTTIPVYRVAAWREEKCRRFGFGQLANRCVLPLYREGTRLLLKHPYDVVYFSTTVFTTFVLARLWKRRFNAKFVFDFQDPWYAAGKEVYDSTNAPGGWLKYRISQMQNRYSEQFALRVADHIISVSEGYVADLTARYPWLKKDQFTVIPFGAAPRDYEIVREQGVRHNIFPPNDGLVHWTYVGRGGPDMAPVLAALFRALAGLKQSAPEFTSRLRLHFVGTNYAPPDRTYNVVEPVAAQWGVADLVEEHSQRIPYFQALALMAESDAVLMIGSVAADYTASKLFNCVLSKKPVLALFHADSLVSRIIPDFPNAKLVAFRNDPSEPEFENSVERGIHWLMNGRHEPPITDLAVQPYFAERLTKMQCEIFSRLVQ